VRFPIFPRPERGSGAVQRRIRGAVAIAAVVAVSAGLGACAKSQRGSESTSDSGGTFVFAASSDPVMLDPAHASDGETFRPAEQIFEGLVSLKPGTTEVQPLLATSWTAGKDGKTFDFTLRKGVKFTDGTDFNAAAVCYNFDRWFNWTGLNQNENISAYYNDIFHGFKTGPLAKDAVYKSCTTNGDDKLTIKLQHPFAAFVQAMTLPSFSMQSPTAMKKYNADDIAGTENDPRFSEYATAHPTGTGPFKFSSWDRGQSVTLVRNDDYWGQKAHLSKIILRTISDPKARTQELESGGVQGYDLVGPADIKPLKDKGYQVLTRPAFNILYMGMNQYNKDLQNLKVRQAISYAIDKQAVVKQSLPEGSIPAKEFMPPTIAGYTDNVNTYDYDPAKAKQLLKEAGFSANKPLTLKFAYPTGVSRPYMPSPEDTYLSIKSQLEAVGIKIVPVSAKWSPDYLDMTASEDGRSKHDLHLLGWTGDYNDPDNFVGVFFAQYSPEWGFKNPKLFADLTKARGLPTREQQVPAYEAINKEISEFIPGVPIAHPAPSLALAPEVKGYIPGPSKDAVWNVVSIKK
jgi:peptide/nickel transport system substrate-binding protein